MDSSLDKLPCSYFSCSEDGVILEVNAPLCRALGYEAALLTGRKVDAIFTLSTRIFYQTHLFPLLKMQGYASEIFLTLRSSTGDDLPVLINAERAGNGALRFAGITVHNRKKFEDELVAARKTAEAALRENTALQAARNELQEQMERLDQQMQVTQQQHEELKQFNRVVTHDLQEPLRKLSVFSHMLMDGVHQKVSTDPKQVVDKLLPAAGNLHAVISGLQQFIWLTEHPRHLVQLQLEDLLPEVQAELEGHFPGSGLQIEVKQVPALYADRDQMRLLLYQLLSNAIRFRKASEPPRVTIAGTVVRQNRFRNLEGKYSYGAYLKLVVSDNGAGFHPELRHQVFELFRRLHPESGRGVGLSLSKKVMENHSGQITADSREGEGTVFTLLLPLPE